MNPLSKPFVPPPYGTRTHKYVNLTIPSHPPDISEGYMDDLCKRVTEHALDGECVWVCACMCIPEIACVLL